MQRLKTLAIIISIAILSGVIFTGVMLSTEQPVEAHGDIESRFRLVENPAFIEPITGAVGHGVFNLDGSDLDNLKYDLEIGAQGLESNSWYYLSVTVREVTGEDFGGAGGMVPVAMAVTGMARTNNKGHLEFIGKGVLPNVFAPNVNRGVKTWRIDQQIRQLGSGEKGNCVECILVCAPTTKVELVQGSELVLFDG